MLTQCRYGSELGRSTYELRTRCWHVNGSLFRADRNAAQLRMGTEAVNIIYARESDIRRGKPRNSRLVIPCREPRRDGAVGFRTVLHACDIGGEAGVGGQLWLLQHFAAELCPFAIALDADEYGHAVCRLKHAIRRDGDMREACALRRESVLSLK